MAELDGNVQSLVEKAIVLSPYGQLLGLVVERCEPDRVVVRLPFRHDVTTVGDTVHGGAIAGLVDTAATAAFWAKGDLAPGSRGTTIGFSLSFLSAGRGVDLVAEACVRRRGREICNGEVIVRDTSGKAVAQAIVTYNLSEPSRAESPAPPRDRDPAKIPTGAS
jgi:uncharacterized protein (TIGR00369 family)